MVILEINVKETKYFCHQLVELNGKKYILDASSMTPKFYYWGVPTEELTVEMTELNRKDLNFSTPINKFKASYVAIIVQPLIGIVYSLLKTFFKEYNISQQIILKLVVFCASILFSYFIFYFTREKERKNVKALLPSSSRRYEMIFKPVSARKQVFDAYIFSVPIIACLALYLSINDGGEGLVLVINSIISFLLLSFLFGKIPILSAYKIRNVTFEGIREIK